MAARLKDGKMKKNILVIINPVSGDGSAKNWSWDIIDILSSGFEYVTVYVSRGVGDIKRAVEENAGKYGHIVCMGGDGTLNEAINGVLKSGADVELGYLPLGTVNDFAGSHGIPKNVRTGLQSIVDGEASEIDAGMLGDRAFSYVAAFGAFTDVSYLTPQEMKSAIGKLAYFSEAAKRLAALKPIRLSCTYGGKNVSGDFIYGMVSNSRTIGGIKFFHGLGDDAMSDGLVELTLVRYPTTAAELQQAIMGLLSPSVQCDSVIKASAEHIRFCFDEPTPWTVDGEFGGEYTEADVSVKKKAIKVIGTKPIAAKGKGND